MKKNLAVCIVLLLLSSLQSWCGGCDVDGRPAREGFSVHGVGLGWSDERVKALMGRELSSIHYPKEGSHFHEYGGGLGVLFGKLDYKAEVLYGSSLEFDGRVVVEQGDRANDITEPPISVIPLGHGGRLVARPVVEGYFFDDKPEFGWKSIPTKGYDRVFRVAYRYQSDDGSVTDAFDMELSIFALGERVERVQLRGIGH